MQTKNLEYLNTVSLKVSQNTTANQIFIKKKKKSTSVRSRILDWLAIPYSQHQMFILEKG